MGTAGTTESVLSLSFDYPVCFTSGVFRPGNDALLRAITRKEPARRHRVAVYLETAVRDAHPELCREIEAWSARSPGSLHLAAPPHVLPGSEVCKGSTDAPLAVAAQLDRLRMDRQSIVLIIGGGAFLDMVGFAAAITHRGVRVVRLPTTVLSQADSGVGVKNGVNAFGKKNLLGTFAPPFAVVNDRELLATLPARERIAGMSEAVKVALIKDAAFFAWIESHAGALAEGDLEHLGELIERSALLHARHISEGGDPFELGASRPLDFGHWAAHKLEALASYEVRHGEAVAIGTALDAFQSADLGLLAPAEAERIARVLESLGFVLWSPELERVKDDGALAILDGVQEFREHLGGELTVMMLEAIGRGQEVHDLDPERVRRGLEWLRRRVR